MRCLVIVLVLLVMVNQSEAAASRKIAQRDSVRTVPQEEQIPGMNILSIIPAQGEPGMTVTLNGTGFTEKTVAFLGSVSAASKVTSTKILTFVIPDLPPGLYALYLKREDGVTSKPYNFLLQAQKPVALGLSPDTVYGCAAGRDREVIVTGRNFREGSQVLLDGAVIKSRVLAGDSISFSVPPLLTSGLHQIQIKNPPEEISGALALFLNTRPEVTNVGQGQDFVNYYELLIEGRNFLHGSSLIINGARLASGVAPAGERERVIYMNCNRLIYQRHPYDTTPKTFTIQVVNPNGEESPVVSVTAP